MSQPVKIAIAGANGRMGQAVAKALEGRADAVVTARFERPGVDGAGLVSRDEIRKGAFAKADMPQLLDTLEGFLKSLPALNSYAVVIIDEAQSLPPKVLDQIRVLGAYEQDGQPIAKDGVLNPDIKPAAEVELVNILNPVQLARFGVNLSVAPSTPTSLPEKIEAMAIGSAFDKTGDVFLLVGSDNDFATAKGRVNGQDFDASLHGDTGTGDNDNLVLVYRLSLPK